MVDNLNVGCNDQFIKASDDEPSCKSHGYPSIVKISHPVNVTSKMVGKVVYKAPNKTCSYGDYLMVVKMD